MPYFPFECYILKPYKFHYYNSGTMISNLIRYKCINIKPLVRMLLVLRTRIKSISVDECSVKFKADIVEAFNSTSRYVP